MYIHPFMNFYFKDCKENVLSKALKHPYTCLTTMPYPRCSLAPLLPIYGYMPIHHDLWSLPISPSHPAVQVTHMGITDFSYLLPSHLSNHYVTLILLLFLTPSQSYWPEITCFIWKTVTNLPVSNTIHTPISNPSKPVLSEWSF